MTPFHRGQAGREGGGFGNAGRGRPGEGRSGRYERRDFGGAGRRRTDEKAAGDFGRGEAGRNFKPQMHKAVCVKCGKGCEVPFKPLPTKQVYCRDCYKKDDSKSRPTQLSEELVRINDKLDRILRALNLG